jgi:glycosyltransferase involved in cell wall biosynthesis
LKILQVTPRLPAPPNDGGAVYVYHMTDQLSKLGHEVTMLSFISNFHEQSPSDVENIARLISIDGEFKPYTLTSVLKSILTWSPISIQHRMDRSKFEDLVSTVNFTPDIILLEGIHTAYFIDNLKAHFPGVPLVLRQSNAEFELLRRNAFASKNPFVKLFYLQQSAAMKHFEIDAIRQVDAVTFITEIDQSFFKEHLSPSERFINPAGVNLPTKLGLKRSATSLLAISNWKWKPNYDGIEWFFNEVWPDLSTLNKEITVDIAGNGLSDSFIGRYSSDRVKFHGFVDDLEPLKQSSCALIAPLFSGSGMKIKIVEALASGLPVITTHLGAEGILLENRKTVLLANEKDQFIDCILDITSNSELRQLLSENSYRLAVQHYTWDQIGQDMESILNQILTDPK